MSRPKKRKINSTKKLNRKPITLSSRRKRGWMRRQRYSLYLIHIIKKTQSQAPMNTEKTIRNLLLWFAVAYAYAFAVALHKAEQTCRISMENPLHSFLSFH